MGSERYQIWYRYVATKLLSLYYFLFLHQDVGIMLLLSTLHESQIPFTGRFYVSVVYAYLRSED